MIGIFDSGIGGLTVVKELMKQDPRASFVYLGDTARTPYGNKSPETIRRYAKEDAQFLIDHGATSLIIACNTATAFAEDALRQAFPDIPVFGVIRPAVAAALALRPKRLGVIGTRGTVGSGIYPRILQEAGANGIEDIEQVACPLFTVLAEEGLLDDQITKLVAKKYLSRMRTHALDALILGCTHYPLLRSVIQHAVSRRTALVDPAYETVAHVLRALPQIERTGQRAFFLTDAAAHTVSVAAQWMGEQVEFQSAHLG